MFLGQGQPAVVGLLAAGNGTILNFLANEFKQLFLEENANFKVHADAVVNLAK